MRKKTEPSSINDLLELFSSKNKSYREFVSKNNVLDNWESLVGKKVADVSEPDKIERDKLYLKVKNSVWKNELFFMKSELLAKINNNFSKGKVKDIIFI